MFSLALLILTTHDIKAGTEEVLNTSRYDHIGVASTDFGATSLHSISDSVTYQLGDPKQKHSDFSIVK